MKPIRLIPVVALAAGCTFASQAALAYSAGDAFVRGGVAQSDVRSDNGEVLGQDVDISTARGFTFGAGYLFTDNIGIELNSSEKFEHDVALGGADLGTIDRMPVNLLVNYYPLGGFDSRVQPYVGAGLNYTRFSGEPEGIDARRSYGAVGQVGIDLAITDNFMLNGFANYADVDARLSSEGEAIGTAKVDPMTIGGGVTFRF
ncbi:MAG: OmpW/AlkL family protein [Halomonadaceae bacterium]|jgi:outer membrane protein|uniref:OmpW/AlkL family protein n=1 Tax=Halomonas sp. MCCC 1A11062 TaxID=2733485 RepID=UPI001F323763|nr:OmpW family outer membrane protein [Halomonas sp. MCCC 1A11062]MCE8039651.1 outer membrane beta-barrel protein [Halomonas sp. MCCC 1A11062]